MMKKISIIVPVYNEEEALSLFYDELKKTIDTILNYEIEILMINDGSKDDSLNIIKNLREKDNRVNYVSF